MEKIVLAGGCFWCVEAVFKRLKGVANVVSGYTGGHLPSPTYEQVCSGNTGHAEAVLVEFDPAQISSDKILEVFWAVHDPTTLNRQGADVGTQYRSAIFYSDERQKDDAERSKQQLEKSGKYSGKVVTEILPLQDFYPAEEYHHDFYDQNREYGYCRLVIDPKITKLYADFPNEAKIE